MNKKNIIQLVIIFACFAASGIVIYNNFVKAPPLPPELAGQTPGLGASVTTDAPILPNGSQFDIKAVQDSKLRFNLLDYPKLDYPSEVGVSEDNVLKPLRSIQNNSNPLKK